MKLPPDRDPLAEAAQAERSGDIGRAASALRAHLGRRPDDRPIRLRLARLLVALGERRSAREVLRPLDQADDRAPRPEASAARPAGAGPGSPSPSRALTPAASAQPQPPPPPVPPPLAPSNEANRLLAELDEAEGALTSAQLRWERILADDIDDPQARAHLAALRPEEQHPPSDLLLGTLVSLEGIRTARFALVRELGRGATSAVYLVRDERLALPLALKVLHPQLAAVARAGARARFFAEARLAARLRHPGVVAIYDVDEDTRSLAMEYVPGGTLRDRLRVAAAPLPGAELLATARSLLEALAHVHRAGIVHGDLKPGNVLVRRPGQVVLADFGSAHVAAAAAAEGLSEGSGAGSRATRSEHPAGTPLYLAPEQFRGAPATARTDLYAAGAILWELAAGHPARRHRDLLVGATTPPPPLPPAALAAIGSALAAAIEGLMAADPSARPTSASAARASLD